MNTVRFTTALSFIVAMLAMLLSSSSNNAVRAFTVVPSSVGASSKLSSPSSSSRLYFFGSGPKDDGSPGDYVCKDCGYVFTKGPKAWAALDNDTYQCPPCGAPKYRFKKVPKGSASGKKVEVKKSWF